MKTIEELEKTFRESNTTWHSKPIWDNYWKLYDKAKANPDCPMAAKAKDDAEKIHYEWQEKTIADCLALRAAKNLNQTYQIMIQTFVDDLIENDGGENGIETILDGIREDVQEKIKEQQT